MFQSPRRRGPAIPLGELHLSSDDEAVEEEYPPSPKKSPRKRTLRSSINNQESTGDEMNVPVKVSTLEGVKDRDPSAHADNVRARIVTPTGRPAPPIESSHPRSPEKRSRYQAQASSTSAQDQDVLRDTFENAGIGKNKGKGSARTPSPPLARKTKEQLAAEKLEAKLWQLCGQDVARWNAVLQFPHISPSLLKSANPWATTKEDLQALCGCPYTGAITTRTSRSSGFKHDPTIHQYAFFDARDHSLEAKDVPDGLVSSEKNGSPNTLGYNPILLHQYLNMTKDISDAIADTASKSEKPLKPVIISVTGDATDVTKCYTLAWTHVRDASIKMPLALEINLSCRNIPDKPPPAYSGKALSAYLHQLNTQMMIFEQDYGRDTLKTATGIKTPPYTYADQFKELIDALLESCKPLARRTRKAKSAATGEGTSYCPIQFITATNTLGSSLLLTDDNTPALASASGAGVRVLAGAPLHPLALGNVKTLRTMLDEHRERKHIQIIGVGGVSDADGYKRMWSVGAAAVGIGTALGRKGVDVFGTIANGAGLA
ncbi:hypothetical protein LTR28_009078 [Elasticomyces elasticus]|nr:hypothetical protein LTR28_009078 [Elasticomyces elasticus]